ncbi:MAG: hypothetical protein WC827_04080 [Candidatus Paceibacterota bacterium]|jgi:hypothetical protein
MKTDITIWIFSAFIIILAALFSYGIYRHEQKKERDSKARLAARDQALLIEQNNQK